MSETEIKHWQVHDFSGKTMSFNPVFVVQDFKAGEIKNATNKEVECKEVIFQIKDDKTGQSQTFHLGFQELFMFVYYIANEELRRALQLRQDRKITEIPYEVTFKLDPSEMRDGMAKRLIKLPVDEIVMSIARAEAQLLKGKAVMGTLEEWFHKKRLQKKGIKI